MLLILLFFKNFLDLKTVIARLQSAPTLDLLLRLFLMLTPKDLMRLQRMQKN